MKRRRKQRDNFVQSLFPFLAVLLSTMGALVLLLMLIVNQAQATAKQMAADKKTEIEDAESNLELLRNSFEEQLDDRRLELERKRLTLQHLEKHIKELMEEFEGIQRTATLLGQKKTQDKTAEAEAERKISQLEKQLTDANIDLKKKLDKPVGEKPIFAIIPYQGTNGTHRRPIYLECTSHGVTIQPEGVVIGLADLRPPYGPGNPLDAAIRTVRSHFAPANGALTSTAYPLLIVRPSGVRTYAMARQAMSGWDDQFGYELIDETLELSYPESEPGIVPEIDQALALARERQAALVMAMPAKYRQYITQGGPGTEALEFEDDAGDMGDEWAGGSGNSSGSGRNGGDGSSGSGSPTGYRGGFAASQGGTAGQRGAGENPGRNGSQTGSRAQGRSGIPGSQQMGFGNGANNSDTTGGTSFFANGSGQADSQADRVGSYFGSSANGSQDNGMPSTGNQPSGTQGYAVDGNSGGGNGEFADSSSRLNSGSSSAYGNDGAGGTGTGTASNNANGGGGSSNGPQRGGSASGPQPGAMAGAGGAAAGGSSGAGTPSMSGTPMSDPSQDPTANPGNPGNPAQMGSPSFNMDMSRNSMQGQRDAQSEPIAQQRGRGWAWREGPPTKTPVVRAIRVVCYHDRWVLMQDNVSTSNQVTVAIGKNPQASAEKLAKAITDRVSGWGIALGGGYWKPELIVDVAPGADARFGQLERLLEGSGLQVQRRANVK
jgi:hypothetical protein